MKAKRTNLKCKVCNKPFSFTEKRMKWFKDHGLEVPTRCSECIKKGRSINHALQTKEA